MERGARHIRCLVLSFGYASLLLVGCTGRASEPPIEERLSRIEALSGNAEQGKTVFAANCGQARCHGADGISGPAPNFDLTAKQFGNGAIARIVLQGSGGGMPSQALLTDQEIADALAWIDRTFRPGAQTGSSK